MNYIKKLESEREALASKLASVYIELDHLVTHLHSDKFRGVDSQGFRKDWISTGDVLNRIREIKSII